MAPATLPNRPAMPTANCVLAALFVLVEDADAEVAVELAVRVGTAPVLNIVTPAFCVAFVHEMSDGTV